MFNCITISPKYANQESIQKFIESGCNMFRLNFSWGTHEEYRQIVKIIREVALKLGQEVQILQDLQGPKLRIQNCPEAKEIKPQDKILISYDKIPKHIQLAASGIYQTESIGKHILVKDGDIKLTIIDVDQQKQTATLESQSMGSFKNMNGCNAPSIELNLEALSIKDLSDLQFALEQNIDIISLSFIHNEQNLIQLKNIVQDKAKILAKIETQTAINNIQSILKHADYCMVARGDLGVEVGLTELPYAQEKIQAECNKQNIPCLIATEVLKSMLTEKHPSRAESHDIHDSLDKGAAGFILTNETVLGENPFLATQWISKFLDDYKKHK